MASAITGGLGPESRRIRDLGATGQAQEEFERLTAELVARLDSVVADGLARIRAAAPPWTRERPEFDEVLRYGAKQSIGAELAALRDGAVLPEALPEIDAEGARLSARSGVPLDVHLFLYRAGHASQWQAWFDLVEREVTAADVRRSLLERGSSFFFSYADRMSRLATDEYQREREQLLRGREQRRVHLVRELLDGSDVDATALDHPLEAWHLGAVARGSAASDSLHAAAEALGRRLLLVELVGETWWGWLSGDEPLSPSRLTRVAGRLSPPTDTAVALGDDSHGVDGFRLTHRQAAQAHEIAACAGGRVTLFDALALEALACQAPDAAAHFVARELRGLDGGDRRSVRLRATLRAYFVHDQNATATAAALGVHEQTVAKRLRAVEQRTGRAVATRRAELETALRLAPCLRAPGPAAVRSAST